MGHLNIIPGASFPASIPKVPIIDGMESPGSLILVEPGHTVMPWPTGMPSTRSIVPNILQSSANTLLGKTATAPTVVWSSMAAGVKIERSSKGGVNVINRTTATVYTDALFKVDFPDDIANYIAANYSHRFFASVWMRTTAVQDSSLAADAMAVLNIQSDPVFGMSINNSTRRYISNFTEPRDFATRLGQFQLANEYNALRSFEGRVAPFSKQLLLAGGNYLLPAAAQAGKSGAQVLYRAYVEDLTVSGRSWAEVSALDASLHAQAFGPGGRYYGDTFTAP